MTGQPDRRWPVLPSSGSGDVSAVARVRDVSGSRLLLLPFAAPTGPSRGRRYRVRVGDDLSAIRVVFAVGGQAALRPPPWFEPDSVAVPVTVAALPCGRRHRIPADLDEALRRAGVSLHHFTDAQVDQILLMIRESTGAAIRAQRIGAAVAAAIAAGRRHG